MFVNVSFLFQPSNRREVAFHCGFDLHLLRTNYFEYISMCLLAIYTSSLGKCLFKAFAHFKIGLSALLLLSCDSSFYIMDTSSLSDIQLQIFSPIL